MTLAVGTPRRVQNLWANNGGQFAFARDFSGFAFTTARFLLSFHGVRLVGSFVVLTRPTVAQAMRLVKTLPCLMQRAESYIELKQRSGSSDQISRRFALPEATIIFTSTALMGSTGPLYLPCRIRVNQLISHATVELNLIPPVPVAVSFQRP